MAARLEPRVKIPGLHHWQLPNAARSQSFAASSMSRACGVTRGAIHQLWEGIARCHDACGCWVRMTDRIRIALRQDAVNDVFSDAFSFPGRPTSRCRMAAKKR